MREASLVDGAMEWSEGGMRDLLVLFPLICVSVAGFRLLNSLIASGAWTFHASTHSLSESGYPFHLIRYCFFRPLPKCQKSRTFSSLYSSSLSMRSGAGLK